MTGFKLSEEELNLHSGDKNAIVFIEVVKGTVTDWINYHHVQVPNRDKIQVFYLSFSAGSSSLAIARIIDKKSNFNDYRFAVAIDALFGGKRNIYVNVYNPDGDRVTQDWDGWSYLGFDKKGYSYELTKEEYYYLEVANKRMSLEDIKAFGVTFYEVSKMFKDFRKGGH